MDCTVAERDVQVGSLLIMLFLLVPAACDKADTSSDDTSDGMTESGASSTGSSGTSTTTSSSSSSTSSGTSTTGTATSDASTGSELVTACAEQTTSEGCLAVEPESEGQDRCHWLELERRPMESVCEVSEIATECVFIPWSGDANFLQGMCGEPEGPGVAFREAVGAIETLTTELYGVDLAQLPGWTYCEYDSQGPEVCECFCESS